VHDDSMRASGQLSGMPGFESGQRLLVVPGHNQSQLGGELARPKLARAKLANTPQRRWVPSSHQARHLNDSMHIDHDQNPKQ
jgi:hypothetical protein